MKKILYRLSCGQSLSALRMLPKFLRLSNTSAITQTQRLSYNAPPKTSTLAGLARAKSTSFIATSEEATRALSAALAARREKGDCLCLRGEVGAGKSAFSRAYIRHVEEDDTVPVPSPTYLLQNIYEYRDGPSIYHYDLYRLQEPAALQKLDLQASLQSAVSLIEWPERLEKLTPGCRLDLHISVLSPEVRARPFAQKLVEISRHEEDSSEDQEEEEEGEFLDNRWRLISLHPHGQRWEESIAALDAQRLSSSGLHLVTQELSQALAISPS